MAGHSKWSKIKRQKAAEDQARGRLFSKLGREIAVAAREGGHVTLGGLGLAPETWVDVVCDEQDAQLCVTPLQAPRRRSYHGQRGRPGIGRCASHLRLAW